MSGPGQRTLLGFDFGKRRIGIAVGQEVTSTATPVTTVAATDGRPDWEAIDRLITTWRPDALVIGVPRHMDGNEHELTRAARHFGRQLRERFGLDVFEFDERLTSREARSLTAARRSAGQARRTRKGDLDQLAAQIILQGWLQQQETDHE